MLLAKIGALLITVFVPPVEEQHVSFRMNMPSLVM